MYPAFFETLEFFDAVYDLLNSGLESIRVIPIRENVDEPSGFERRHTQSFILFVFFVM